MRRTKKTDLSKIDMSTITPLPAGEIVLRDSGAKGLALRLRASGARTWIMLSREGSKTIRRTLGDANLIPLSAARRIATDLAAPSPAPATEDHEERPFGEDVRIAELLPHFFASGKNGRWKAFQAEHEGRCGAFYKPQGLYTYKSYVRRKLMPAFAGKRIDTITRQDIVRWFERYSATSPGGANRALGILGQMLGRAKAWGYMPEDWRNPVSGIKANRRRIVGAFLSEDQMARLGAVLDRRIADGCTASALIRFLTLTGCRVSEAIDLEWRDVLSDRLRLRDSKTGARDVALGIPTRRFLKEHRAALDWHARGTRSPVFPLAGGQRYEAVRSVWLIVRREAQLPGTLRIHDLRHSFASHAIMSGETLFCTSRLLGHSRIQMTARYAHLADTALLAAAERIGTILMKGRQA